MFFLYLLCELKIFNEGVVFLVLQIQSECMLLYLEQNCYLFFFFLLKDACNLKMAHLLIGSTAVKYYCCLSKQYICG